MLHFADLYTIEKTRMNYVILCRSLKGTVLKISFAFFLPNEISLSKPLIPTFHSFYNYLANSYQIFEVFGSSLMRFTVDIKQNELGRTIAPPVLPFKKL